MIRYSMDGGFDEPEMTLRQERLMQQQESQPAPDAGAGAPAAPAAPEMPPADPEPGPNNSPAPQQGNPPPQAGPPPAVVSSVPGVKASEATGGVQGSFGQAGEAGFSKRFGLPAAWFKGGPTAGLAREASNRGREVLGRDRAGVVSGGYGAETVGNTPAGPSQGLMSGGKNDEEWQRLIQAVMQQRFGRG